ncbi:gamma-glutamyl-gamma-aminobutyrate hydrolase family protein [Streptococcus sp. zg-JUN1979]|uniref:gamma-glutamyl-gamma-aminobutyrate hydrolase family protein n=1 Tax=Streptococcus sp. zg-JUN1979 TaxID=3391450 RepID=UPI0039A62E54
MTKPIIGITANQRIKQDINIPWSYAPTGFVKAIQQAGGLPLLLPISNEEDAKTYVSMVDKILLIGGQNVDPSYYHEERQTTDTDFFRDRDIFEMAVIKEAIRQKKPIFGVCRGLQLMNVALGGSLNQAIKGHWQNEEGNVRTHPVIIKNDCVLSKIYGAQAQINSFHRQSIKTIADALQPIAFDPDTGVIEAAVSKDDHLTFLGVQWHPELLIEDSPKDMALFDYFVNEL